jgi:uncharacterized protein (TIGR01777 family)
MRLRRQTKPRCRLAGQAMIVLVTGSTGLIGSALVQQLAVAGHHVRRLVRSRADHGDDSFLWDPTAGTIDREALEGTDAVVHLAGETVAGRWTDDKKARIRDSRVVGTGLLSSALVGLDRPPRVLVSASAIGYYGDRGEERLTEGSAPGEGFLTKVVYEWETATEPARTAGIRVVNIRNGVVLSPAGGALARMLTPFRLGIGGRLGSGRQYMSWITLGDEARAILHAIVSDEVAGPVNLTAPNPVTNGEFAKALGRALGRPAILPTPTLPLALVFGREFVQEALLASARVLPARLLESGFEFEHPQVEAALRALLQPSGGP